ncbi:epimerase [Nonomuraea sp. KC401]|uniref:epimerase n=1 Tax=unclassified Nonomuraea TaxID=2593643 RepID=UPI0010FD964B|nr:epimerase [Nonomuraea sp. KC401]NBE97784.1 epimerase [Nonomuraea sp. K271]TLF58613.1 epimerase [Nonomuraea sp. KC401]
MKVILFGATGTVGRGVLRECLRDDRVTAVLAVGPVPSGAGHAKLREIVHADLLDLATIEAGLRGHDAAFLCVEGSRHVDVALSVGETLARVNPGSVFVYVSAGAGGNGAAENALLALPLRSYVFRPGHVRPSDGVTSPAGFHRLAYIVVRPLYPVLRRIFPATATTPERIGRAMITVAERGAPRRVLGPDGINAL